MNTTPQNLLDFWNPNLSLKKKKDAVSCNYAISKNKNNNNILEHITELRVVLYSANKHLLGTRARKWKTVPAPEGPMVGTDR